MSSPASGGHGKGKGQQIDLSPYEQDGTLIFLATKGIYGDLKKLLTSEPYKLDGDSSAIHVASALVAKYEHGQREKWKFSDINEFIKQFESNFGLKKNGRDCYSRRQLPLINNKYIPREDMKKEMLGLLRERMKNYKCDSSFNHKIHKLHKIIGAPGSGKTTLLHQITSYMMGDFASDFQQENKNNDNVDTKKLNRGVMGIYVTYDGDARNSYSDYDKQSGNETKEEETKSEAKYSINPQFLWRLLYEISDEKISFDEYCKKVWKEFENSRDLVPSTVGKLFQALYKEFIVLVSIDELNHLPKQIQIDTIHTAAMLHDHLESGQLFHVVCAGACLDRIFKYCDNSGRQFEDVSCGLFERNVVNQLFKPFVDYWTGLHDVDIRLLHTSIYDTMGFPKFVKILFDICDKYTKEHKNNKTSTKSCKIIHDEFEKVAVATVSTSDIELDKNVIDSVLSRRRPLLTDDDKLCKIGNSQVSWDELERKGIITIDTDGTVYMSRLMIAKLKTTFKSLDSI